MDNNQPPENTLSIKKTFENEYYPIILKQCNLSLPYQVTENITISKLLPSEQLKFFGLEFIDYEFRPTGDVVFGFINLKQWAISENTKGLYSAKQYLNNINMDHIFFSNYILSLRKYNNEPSYSDIRNINTAFSLCQPTGTKAYLYFTDNPMLWGIHPEGPAMGIFDYLSLDEENIGAIALYFNLINTCQKKDTWDLCEGFYREAISGHPLKIDMRFLMLTILLEKLYLPECNDELRYKLSLRTAKTMEKYNNDEPKEIFDLCQSIYSIRSKIVHGGNYKKDLLQDEFIHLVEIARISLRLFLEHNDWFEEDNLKYLGIR